MNKVVLWMQSSIDGRTAGPDDEFDWPVVKEELQGSFVEELRNAGMFLYGRRVYNGMAAFWPTADADPDAHRFQAEFARLWRPMPKAVFSRTLTSAEWNTTVVADVQQVKALREQADGDLVLFGGSDVVASFVAHDLIDEYQIFVHPVALGGGSRLFPTFAERLPMSLVSARSYDDAVVSMRYVRDRD